ncbi:MAG: Zn-ribbon domain-containing OB-fold protein [Actinomycetota bacterium]
MTDARPPLPLPEIAAYAAPYWAAASEHRLVLQHCLHCDRIQHFPRPFCIRCLGDDLDFVAASGLGTVYTFTVVRRHPDPVFAARLPYVIALVDLDDGVRIHTNLVGCPPDTVRVGQRVEVCFEDVDDTHAIPLFTPVRDDREDA